MNIRIKRKFLAIVLSTACCGLVQGNSTKITLTGGYPTLSVKTKIEKNVSNLLLEFKKSYNDDTYSLNLGTISIEPTARNELIDIWTDLKFYCAESVFKGMLLKTQSGYELRNIPVTMNDRTAPIVVCFNTRGDINGISFAIEEAVYEHIMKYKNISSVNEVQEETRKKIIVNFLECMRTAYMTKNIDFIKKIYDDHALIIVGRSIRGSNTKSVQLHDSNKEVFYAPDKDRTEYIRLTKDEYVNRLEQVFKNNRKIQLDFYDIEVAVHPKERLNNLYGVKLIQKWEADKYGDTGYLFLAVSFKENEDPIIWVRTWQDARTTDPNDRIGFEDLKFK